MSLKPLNDKLIKCDKLETAVKRYFELKENGIRSFEDTNEHLELLKQIKEMVGIEE